MGLADSVPRSATVSASSDCDVVPINEDSFKFLVQEHPTFALWVVQELSRRIRERTPVGLLLE